MKDSDRKRERKRDSEKDSERQRERERFSNNIPSFYLEKNVLCLKQYIMYIRNEQKKIKIRIVRKIRQI